ncbi:MAG: hypothetical protein Q7S77_02285 [Candidatus Staskawiczbacteria bacterium]|nr:hypothetical protein [Candidatus Staskawiczbacteria bacterium]
MIENNAKESIIRLLSIGVIASTVTACANKNQTLANGEPKSQVIKERYVDLRTARIYRVNSETLMITSVYEDGSYRGDGINYLKDHGCQIVDVSPLESYSIKVIVKDEEDCLPEIK